MSEEFELPSWMLVLIWMGIWLLLCLLVVLTALAVKVLTWALT